MRFRIMADKQEEFKCDKQNEALRLDPWVLQNEMIEGSEQNLTKLTDLNKYNNTLHPQAFDVFGFPLIQAPSNRENVCF